MDIKKIGIVTSIFSAFFLAYCVYFDYKRTSDVNYKKNVKEKRRRKRELEKKRVDQDKPDLSDIESVQKYVAKEFNSGQNCILNGEFEKSLDHFYNAIIYCSEPELPMQFLEKFLPTEIFILLQARLANTKRLPTFILKQANQSSSLIVDDDLE